MRKLSAMLPVSVFLAAMLPACVACTGPAGEAPATRPAVLLRTYFIPLRADVPLGAAHPSLSGFLDSGTIPGGQTGKEQLKVLATRFTQESLAYQFSNVKPMDKSGETVLEMGFGEAIQIKVANLADAGGGSQKADFSITYGPREVFKRQLAFKPGECVILAGHLESSLPILSVFSLEIRQFTPDQDKAYEDFLNLARLDAESFAPPPPQQRDQEPYLPGIGGVSMPELISRSGAVYPDAAKAEKIEGQVIVEVVVDKTGKANRPRVLTPTSIFDASALQAAVTYRYKPALKDGKPVSVTMNIIIVFKYSMRPT
jgi:TonB family protein